MNDLLRVGRRLLITWAAVTTVALAALAAGILSDGVRFFYSFQGPADASKVEIKFLVFVIAWLWLGFILVLTQRPELLRRHGAFLVVWIVLGLGYLNVVRGPHKVEHLDFSNYFNAAEHMHAGQPLTDDPHQLYLYPPLLATLIEPAVPAGLGPASWGFRFGNYAALLLTAILCYALLQRLGAGRTASAAIVLLALTANVPVFDTLAAQQINLHVANLILACLLLFPRHVALSAAAVALGAHLKVYPVVLALPFLLLRQWRWLAWCAATALAVVVFTSAANSFSYYEQFLRQLSVLHEYGIRNASVASLLHNTAAFVGLTLGAAERPLAMALQLGLAGLALWWGRDAMRTGVLLPDGEPATRIAGSSIIVLSVVMLLVSPSIWPHHLALALLPSLALLLAVRTAPDAMILGLAWFLVFLVPVNEIYPFAYLKLLGLLLLAWLFHRVSVTAAVGLPSLALSRGAAVTA